MEKEIIERTNGIYILNVEASDIANHMERKWGFKKDWTGLIPYSLELIELRKNRHLKIENFGKNKTRERTWGIVNVKFEYSQKKYNKSEVLEKLNVELNLLQNKTTKTKKEESKITNLIERISKINQNKDLDINNSRSSKELREHLYRNGFTLIEKKYNSKGEVKEIEHKYVRYKRSSSKARVGNVLFIEQKMYKHMKKWSRLGIEFTEDEDCDIASLMAYESLSISGIEKTIDIQPHEILLINDIDSPYKCKANVVSMDKAISKTPTGKERRNKDGGLKYEYFLKTETKDYYGKNSIFDGQGLLSHTLFEIAKDKNGNEVIRNGKPKYKKGMMLLRNHFFKCCGFNTNIQQFFYDKGYKDDDVIDDIYGNKIKVKDIKLITTPNSMKILKFAYKIGGEKECYDYWKNNITSTFGVVKSEKPSGFGRYYNQYTYQVLNSMDFSMEDMIDLCKDEVEYVTNLKNDIDYFKHFIGVRNEENDEDYTHTKEMFLNILAVNNDVQYTNIFKKFRRDQISNYVSKLRTGHIKIRDMDYCVMVSNPYEMLLSCIGEYKSGDKSLHIGRELWTTKFKNLEELTLTRNPHILANNVIVGTNVYHKEFNYFNLTDNIVIVNSTDNDIMERANSCDFDSDTILITNNKTVLKRAKECDTEDYPTPINEVKAQKEIYKLKMSDKDDEYSNITEVDYKISENLIGLIINWSQILNSYYFNFKKNGVSKERLKYINDKTSILAVLSCIEIDKAKKLYAVDSNREVRKICNLDFIKKEIDVLDNSEFKKKIKYKYIDNKGNTKIKNLNKSIGIVFKRQGFVSGDIKLYQYTKERLVRPMFFKYCGAGTNYKFEYFNCPMDYLQQVLDSIPKAKHSKNKTLMSLIRNTNLKGSDTRQADSIIKIVNELDVFIKAKKTLINDDNKQSIMEEINNKTDLAINKIKSKKINPKTIVLIFYREGKRNSSIKNIRTKLISILYKTFTYEFINSFKLDGNTQINRKNKGDIVIWGEKYEKMSI